VPVEEREGNSSGDRDDARDMPPVWIRKHQGEEKQGRRRDGILQGLIHNYRKLQGLVCKAKFPINPKPE
jgi:hypothetical protein